MSIPVVTAFDGKSFSKPGLRNTALHSREALAHCADAVRLAVFLPSSIQLTSRKKKEGYPHFFKVPPLSAQCQLRRATLPMTCMVSPCFETANSPASNLAMMSPRFKNAYAYKHSNDNKIIACERRVLLWQSSFFESNGLKMGMRVYGVFRSFVRAEREVGICGGVLRSAERILPMSLLRVPSV